MERGVDIMGCDGGMKPIEGGPLPFPIGSVPIGSVPIGSVPIGMLPIGAPLPIGKPIDGGMTEGPNVDGIAPYEGIPGPPYGKVDGTNPVGGTLSAIMLE
jgi:hypothetical protein